MPKDLDNLSAAELQGMMADMKQVLERRVKQDLETLRAEIDAKLKAAGYSLDEVYSARLKHKAERKLPKYADPANPVAVLVWPRTGTWLVAGAHQQRRRSRRLCRQRQKAIGLNDGG